MLRIEVIVHNTKELRGGRSREHFPKIVTRLENLPRPTVVGATRVGGINYNQARMRKGIEAVVALATAPSGFSASELAAQVRALSDEQGSPYGPRQAAYDIKKLRGKEVVQKRGNSRRYECQ